MVYPRLVDLDGVFTQGIEAHQGRRLALWRPAGFDLHSVREYQQGESLRKVHWPTTARRGELMVKDFDDAARDEIAVILDAEAAPVVGTPPSSSFEAQVRAAGSILLAHVQAGRRSVLVVNGARRSIQEVHTAGGEWRQALELLASVEPDGTEPLGNLLADEASPATRALELVVVTAAFTPTLVDRLAQRARAGAALRWCSSTPPASRAARSTTEPLLLKLQGAGIPLAVMRSGDDLAEVLGPCGARGPRMARTILLYLLPAFLVVTLWSRLEQADGTEGRFLWIAVLALAPALLRPLWARVVAYAVATALAIQPGVRALDAGREALPRRGLLRPLHVAPLARLRGVLRGQPAFRGRAAAMHGAILVAAFAFCSCWRSRSPDVGRCSPRRR